MRNVFVVSQPKTATQSVFRSLAAVADLRVHHAHWVDRPDVRGLLGKPLPAEPAQLENWRWRIEKQYNLLVQLLDARQFKTIVVIRREPVARLVSELVYTKFKLIEPLYDAAADCFDVPDLVDALSAELRRRVTAAKAYDSEVYGVLGVPLGLLDAGYGVHPLRSDLEVVVLRFEKLDQDFASLARHLKIGPLPLVRINELRDKQLDAPGETRSPTDRERLLYAAFKRDFAPYLPSATELSPARLMPSAAA